MNIFRGPRRKAAIVVVGAVGAVAVSTAAIAAVLFFATGSFTAAAAATPTLTINPGAHLSGPLVPGQPAVDGIVGITNPNTFPVKVTRVLVKTSGLAVTPAACDINSLTLGGSAGTINSQVGNVFDIADVTLAAGATADITVPAVVSQAGTATELCGVQADYVVEGAVGN
jgi:hypothetical protein